MFKKVLSGLLTGGLFSGFVNPCDLVKIRMQGEAGRVGADGLLTTGLRIGQRPSAGTSFGILLHIMRTEGAAALYRGTAVTSLRAALGRGAQLSTYDHTKHLLRPYIDEGFVLHVFAALMSALGFCTACAPADIVKTRLLDDKEGKYSSAIQCFRSTLAEDGFMGLYRGWLPSVGRLGPLFCAVAPAMEQLRILMGVGYF